MKGYIFDFNGTMFFDSHIHTMAWREYLQELCGIYVNDDEMRQNVLGRSNPYILTHFLGSSIPPEKIEKMGHEKEARYRSICLKNPSDMHLVEGVTDFLDLLKEKDIPFTIATAAEIANLLFYFEVFKLDKWFSLEKIVYDDGIIRSKPFPDIYLKAASLIDVPPQNCAIFEDSLSGLTAAAAAGAGKIYALNAHEDNSYYEKIPGIYKIIRDYKNTDLLMGD